MSNFDPISYDKAGKAEKKAIDALTGYENYKQLVDDVIDEDITKVLNSAIIQTDIETKLNAKEAEYAPRLTTVESDLEEKKKQIIESRKLNAELATIKRNVPLISFVDDDGSRDVLTKLLPLSIMHDIPFVLGIPSQYMIDSQEGIRNGLKPFELKELQDVHKFEIASHGKTHIRLDENASENNATNEDELLDEIYGSWKTLREYGLNTESMVYPSGANSVLARSIVQRYYKVGVGTDSGLNGANGTPIRTYNTRRVPFPKITETGTLEYYKSVVDDAIQNNAWLIWMLHCGQSAHDAVQQQHLNDLIAYIKTTSAKIVTCIDGIGIAGNPIDLNDQSLYVSKTGKNNIRDLIYERTNKQTGDPVYSVNTPPSAFEDNKVSVTEYPWVDTPNASRGTLVTFKNRGEILSSQLALTRRDMFYRDSPDNVTWDEFRRVLCAIERTISVNVGTIPANSSVFKDIVESNFVPGRMVIMFPNALFPARIIVTHAITGNQVLGLTFLNTTSNPIEVGSVPFRFLIIR